MSYMLRDRPDGQFEIVMSRRILVGIFPEKDTASRVMFFLQEDDIDLTEDAPALFGRASQDVAEAYEAADIGPVEIMPREKPAKAPRSASHQLPAVIDKPQAARQLVVTTKLSDEAQTAAFARIAAGEKLAVVAPDYLLTMFQLRGLWANHLRHTQKHMAEGGKVACGMCKTPFTPSISHPDTCARCSRD